MNFLSRPVICGFSSAAALIIATSQIGKIFGVQVEAGTYHFQTVYKTICAAISGTHWPTVAIAFLALVIMLGLRRLRHRIPYVLIAVVVTTLVSWLMGFNGRVVGEIPQALPQPNVAHLSLSDAPRLLPSAFAVALVGLMEAIAIAKRMAIKTRRPLDVSQEFVGQGLANIIGGLFQGYTVSGSFSRSAVNLAAGARTGFSSVISSVVVLLTLLFVAPLLRPLPEATFAGIIVISVLGLFRIKPLVQAWRIRSDDGIAGATTFLVTLAFAPQLQIGVFAGILLSLVLYLRHSMSPRISVLSRHADGSLRDAGTHGLGHCPTISIIRFERSLYFANANHLEEVVLSQVAEKPQPKHVIFDAEGVNRVDATGIEMLIGLVLQLRQSGVGVHFSRVRHPVRGTILSSGLLRIVGEEHLFSRTQDALDWIWKNFPCECGQECALRKAASLGGSAPGKNQDSVME